MAVVALALTGCATDAGNRSGYDEETTVSDITGEWQLTKGSDADGTWTVNGGATYYYLGSDSLRNFNTAPANDVRDAGNSEWVFSGGLSVAF